MTTRAKQQQQHHQHASEPHHRKLNPEAIITRQILREAGVFTVSLTGSPGCGRTTLINTTVHTLEHVARVGVVVANLAMGRRQCCARHVAHVDSDQLDAGEVRRAIDSLPLDKIDLLLIESTYNCCQTAEIDLGEQARVAVFDVGAGDDKAAEAARLIRNSSLVLLNKRDLLPHVHFDVDAFHADVARANATAAVIEISTPRKLGIEEWVRWLNQQRLTLSKPKGGLAFDDWFMGLKLITTESCTCLKGPAVKGAMLKGAVPR